MNAIQTLRQKVVQLIYLLEDIDYLQRLKTDVEEMVQTNQSTVLSSSELPWKAAKLEMKELPTFESIYQAQGSKKLTFDELLPNIVEEPDYTIYELLSALKN
jgi:hypothetical protein